MAKVNQYQLELYEDIFLKGKFSRKTFIASPPGKKDFRTVHKYLSTGVIDKHLNDKQIVGARIGVNPRNNDKLTTRLILDMDQSQLGNIREAYEFSINVVEDLTGIPSPSFLFNSSDSGNLHAWYLLDRSVNEHLLDKFRKVITARQPGIEVYPSNRAIRLPLGINSYVLDTTSLEPITFDKGEAIEFIYNQIDSGEVEEIHVPTLRDKLQQLMTSQHTGRARRKRNKIYVPGNFRSDVEKLETVGLTEQGTRNEAKRKLIASLIMDGYTSGEILTYVNTWERDKSNFMSKDVNGEKWAQMQAETISLISSFDFQKGKYSTQIQELTEDELNSLEDIVLNFKLTEGKKYKLLHILTEIAKLCKAKNSNKVYIAHKLWRKFGDWNNMYKPQLLKAGLIEQIQPGRHGTAARYKINVITT